jgi:hypothetical protein
VLSDSSRQVVVECFLGLRLNEHFPSLTLPYQGERTLPLGEAEDDEADLENSPPSTLKDKAGHHIGNPNRNLRSSDYF